MTDTPIEREGNSTWARLRRRKVVQWGLAYAAASWALLQGIGFVADAFGWPAVAKQLATIALLIGLPIALTLAWYHGDKGEQRVTRPELLILAFLLLGGGALLWHFERASRTETVPTASATQISSTTLPANDPSIAVLPFEDMSERKDQEYFADGMAEEVLNLLTQLPQLRVIARTSSFSFKGKQADVATIAKALNVAHVLEGSVRKSGDTLRITAQLIRASDSSHLWSQTYDRKLTDLFQVQDEIAAAVVAALKVKLLPEQQVTNKYRTTNTEAYNQYLLGNRYFDRGTPDDFRRAVGAYRQAIELDPDYASAYAKLAFAQYFASEYTGSLQRETAGKDAATGMADQAIALAPELADAYAARGFLRLYWTRDLEGAGTDLERALSLEPNGAEVLKLYGGLLFSLGRPQDSRDAAIRLLELDPLSSDAWTRLGQTQIATRQWTQARDALGRALAISPDSIFAHWSLGQLEMLQGRPREAREAFLQTDSFWRLAGLAMAEHSLNHPQESQQALDELVSTSSAYYQIALVHAWRGEKDKAFAALQKAYDSHDGGLLALKSDPMADSLHSDPRYEAMVKKMGLPL